MLCSLRLVLVGLGIGFVSEEVGIAKSRELALGMTVWRCEHGEALPLHPPDSSTKHVLRFQQVYSAARAASTGSGCHCVRRRSIKST